MSRETPPPNKKKSSNNAEATQSWTVAGGNFKAFNSLIALRVVDEGHTEVPTGSVPRNWVIPQNLPCFFVRDLKLANSHLGDQMCLSWDFWGSISVMDFWWRKTVVTKKNRPKNREVKESSCNFYINGKGWFFLNSSWMSEQVVGELTSSVSFCQYWLVLSDPYDGLLRPSPQNKQVLISNPKSSRNCRVAVWPLEIDCKWVKKSYIDKGWGR